MKKHIAVIVVLLALILLSMLLPSSRVLEAARFAQPSAQAVGNEPPIPSEFTKPGCETTVIWQIVEGSKKPSRLTTVRCLKPLAKDDSPKGDSIPALPDNTATTSIGCGNWDTGVSLTFRTLAGNGSYIWYYKYYDENGRLRTTNRPRYYPAPCPTGYLCEYYSGVDQDPNKWYTTFSVGWTGTCSITDYTCWHL